MEVAHQLRVGLGELAEGAVQELDAGGVVTDLNGCPMRYGKPDYRNGDFVAWGTPPGSSK